VLPRGSAGIDPNCVTEDGEYDPSLIDEKKEEKNKQKENSKGGDEEKKS